MTKKFVCRNVFETDPETFWSKVFFDDEYNRGLYLKGLGFKSYEPIELKEEPDGTKRRRFRTEPQSDAPAVVKKLVGDSLSYVETGSFDPKTKVWTYKVETSKLGEKVRISGRYWVEARGPKTLERCCEVEIAVDVFGVGGIVEGFIESTTRDSYEKATAYTNQFLRSKGYNA
jgi:hypothetical protein